MQLFCPACNAAFPRASRCPKCGGLLLMPHEVAPDAPQRSQAPPAPVQPTAVGRIAMGTILAMGLYLAVRKGFTAALLASGPEAATWWLSFNGLVAVHAAQAVAVVFGAVVAAAGRLYGYSLGFIVGGICGGLFLGYELLAGAPPQALVLYLQPPVLALLGLVAGVVGARVWVAPPDLNIPIPTGSKLSSLQLGADVAEEQPRPTRLVQILAGAAIMVVGVVVADQARHFLQRNSAGMLRVQNLGQGEFITWQLATLLVLTGGVVAGAGTGAGIRHGVMAGIIGGAGVLGICVKQGATLPPVEYWLVKTSLDGLPLTAPPVITAVAGGVLFLALLGGWLGGALFLPLAPESMRKRVNVGMD
jgi:hypothetical protein